DDARARWYAGEISLAPPHPATLHLADLAWDVLVERFGPDPRVAHARSQRDFLDGLRGAREALWGEVHRSAVRGVLVAGGCAPDAFAIDRLRLRGVPPGGPPTAAARAAWAIHRDTWYANPPAQVNLWIPLADVRPETSVQIYPRH